jgi:hypothetical protein
MKIITMQRRTLDGKPVDSTEDNRDWWCVIETEEEEMVYKLFLENISTTETETPFQKLWNSMIKNAGRYLGLSWGDDDLYGYILAGEPEPEVGEIYTDSDNDIWERVK